MDDADRRQLLGTVAASQAMVLVSGYLDLLYDELLAGWTRVECAARAHRNSPRTEVLWINPAADSRRRCYQPMLELVA